MPSPLNWTRDEILVVLDAVDRSGWAGLRASSAEAIELSALLIAAHIHPQDDRPNDFRTPASVQRKTEDIRTARPDYQGAPTRGGAATRELVLEWLLDPTPLREEARLVRELMRSGEPLTQGDEPGAEAAEGQLIESLVRRRERDRSLRTKKLAAVARAGQTRACEVCGFDADLRYGAARSSGYVEVHHVVPLHVSGATTTSLDDLVLVCANCHRMLHRRGIVTPAVLRAELAGHANE